MSIISFNFLVLLLISVIIYYIFPKKYQWIVLLVASGVFYCFAATPYTAIYLLLTTAITYLCTLQISKNRKKVYMIIPIVVILAVWILFKLPFNLGLLPALGMSYYSLMSIAYVVDCYKGKIEANKNPLKLLLFVCFFPQLTTGPISRYSQLEALYEGHNFSYEKITWGAQRILWGFAKKLILAEKLNIIINAVTVSASDYGTVWQGVAVMLYPLQLFADFSGSIDIVIGSAELFGIDLPENFDGPFLSRTIKEFWQRWHITLGSFLRDYIYIPLGGSRKGKIRKYINIIIVFVISGFWHGATLGFLIWGLLQAVYQILEELFKPICDRIAKIFSFKTESFGWHFFQSVRTYILFAVSMSFFRLGCGGTIDSFKSMLNVMEFSPWQLFDGTYQNMGLRALDLNAIVIMTVLLIVGYVIKINYVSVRKWMSEQSVLFRWMVWLLLFFGVLIYGNYGPGYDTSSFIYGGF